jgi:sulfur carrier protein ThiS
MATIRFTNRLDRHVDCPQENVAGESVHEVLQGYFSSHEKVEGYVLDEAGNLRTHMAIFIDGKPIKDRDHLGQPVGSDAVIDIVQALSGG